MLELLKIKTIKAATLFGFNQGIRTHYDYTNAVLCDSLFLDFMLGHGLRAWKESSTRDIICLDFSFGTRSFDEEINHLVKTNASQEIIDRVQSHRDHYRKLSKEELREDFYINGVDVQYPEETIHYKMLYRNSSKAKVGMCMFINSTLYDTAYDWLTMGLGKSIPLHNSKIVELSAYSPLTTSTIVEKFYMPVENIVILEDLESVFRTTAKVVQEENGQCVVHDAETDVKNVMWDGMALIDKSVVPESVNGMALLRNHFFKACAFKTDIHRFFCDWYGESYSDDIEITDMFGVPHRLGDIDMITTNNAIKWMKFRDVMGDNPYEYWKSRVKEDGEYWGIVKTDHPSKLGDVQQMSYQMVNTLPCDSNDIFELADTSVQYVERMKNDDNVFETFLRKNANAVNHYEMMADLYRHNPDFAKSEWFRDQKKRIINKYVTHLKSGKITVAGDNLTVCGNPYALLMYAVGGKWENDPTLRPEEGVIQCYTTLFSDGEYLCGIRSPHNSPNNISYLRNRRSSIMDRYFCFSDNIIAVNCIETDIQARMNGMDFDSDFMFVTNNPVMVRSAEKAYRDYPTIVNAVPESGITYDNTMEQYALMDNRFAQSQLAIGESSNVAQLAMSYYWTHPSREYYDIFIILSVLAQLAIDSVKRLYSVNVLDEIKRIRSLDCMKEYRGCDFPEFMQYTRSIQTTKNGKAVPYEELKTQKDKLKNRLNPTIDCPMNGLIVALDGIKRMKRISLIPTDSFFVREKGKANNRQLGKIRQFVEAKSYDLYLITHDRELDFDTKEILITEIYDEIIEQIQTTRITNKKTINRLIETAMGMSGKMNGAHKIVNRNTTILRLLYRMDPEKFISNFVAKNTNATAA